MDALAPAKLADKTEALARRYGAAIPPAGPWNDTIASMLDHRSVRGYKPDPVPPGTLETLMAAATSAATSSNMQWWSAIAVSDPAKKKVLAEIAGGQKHIEQCPLYICWVADMARNARISQAEKTDFECMPWLETFMVACVDAADSFCSFKVTCAPSTSALMTPAPLFSFLITPAFLIAFSPASYALSNETPRVSLTKSLPAKVKATATGKAATPVNIAAPYTLSP